MLLQENPKSKRTKRIFPFAAVFVVIVFGLGILVSRQQVPYLNLVSIDMLKISTSDTLEPSQECLGKPDGYEKWVCLGLYFEKFTAATSVSLAIAEATRLNEEGVVSSCHVIAHYIGEAAWEKNDFDMGKAFSSCTLGCNKGCFHAVMQQHLRYQTDPYTIISQIKNMCDGVSLDTDTFYLRMDACVHGLGHGLAGHSYLPLLDAVNACETFDEPHWTKRCVSGVIMQNMDQYLSLDEDHLREIIPEICDPFESVDFAISVDPRLMEYCIKRVADGLLFYTGYDIERTEELCEELSKQDDINVCKNGIYEHIKRKKRKKPSNIEIQKKVLESVRINNPLPALSQ